MEKLRHPEDLPKVMSLQLLSEITNDFSEEHKLGSGTYGKVYKGVHNGTEIAVKMLNWTKGSDEFEQFKKEFENLARLKHQNIIQLLGYCYEIKVEYVDIGNGKGVFAHNIYRALCFEYMHNGSLYEYLSDAHHGLDWQERYRIIKGICNGLKYLHQGLENPMYHLDLKPNNILLDNNMVPKLADFGLSKLVGNNQTHSTQSLYGTIGYVPPEFFAQGLVSNKFDIFSLGVIMIRIMTGYEGYFKIGEMSSQEFIDLVQKSWRDRLQITLGCVSLDDECHQVKRCIEIALDCVKADRKQRPDIGTIIHWLSETDHVNDKLGIGSPHKTRHDSVSHMEKASSSVSDLVGGVSSMDIAAAPSPAQQISSVTDWPIETSTEESSSVPAAPSPLQRITGVLQGTGGTCRKILYDQSSESSKLLDIHPLELRFPWEPNQEIQCPVTLTNRTDRCVGVRITQICKDTRSNIFFIVPCSDASDDSLQDDSDDESPTILQGILNPNLTIATALKMKSRQEPPIDTMFEVLMVVTESKEHLENLDPSIGRKLNIDSEFLKRIEKFGGEVHVAMLKAIICDPAICQSVIHNQRLISAPSGFDYIKVLDVHPTETWILVLCSNSDVSILNYETQELEMELQIKRVRKEKGSIFSPSTWKKHTLSSTSTRSRDPVHITSAKFIAQEQWFVVGDSDGWIHAYSYTTKDKVMEFQPHKRSPNGDESIRFAVHPTYPFLLTSETCSVKLWDWSKGWRCLREFKYYFRKKCYLRWSPMDTDTFVSTATYTDGMGRVVVWNIHYSNPITTLEGCYKPHFCFYRDVHQNFMITHDRWYTHIWDNMQMKKSVHRLYLQDKGILQYIACHPTLPILVTQVGYSTICVWDTRTYRLVELIDNDPKIIGHMVLTGTKDSPRLILPRLGGVSVMEINMPTLDAADLHVDGPN